MYKGVFLPRVYARLPENGKKRASRGNFGGKMEEKLDAKKNIFTISVVIVDDHELILMGISTLLADAHSIKIVGTAQNGEEAIELADRLNPNVMLMDVNMPVMDGMMASRTILKNNKNQKIILVSSIEKSGVIEKAIKIGIKGYVVKGSKPLEVIEAIHEVYFKENEFIYKGPHMLTPHILNVSPFNVSYR